MGSKSQVTTQKQYSEVPDWLKEKNETLTNQILNNSNQWANPDKGSIQESIINSALGQNLNQVNEKEQELFNKQLAMSNNNLQRQYAAAGRGGSYSNMEALNDQTTNATNQFLSDNYNRNRQQMLNAQQQYLSGVLNANNQSLGAIRQNSAQVHQDIQPGNSWFENAMNVAGVVAPIIAAPLTGGASLGLAALGSAAKAASAGSETSQEDLSKMSKGKLALMGALQGFGGYSNPYRR